MEGGEPLPPRECAGQKHPEDTESPSGGREKEGTGVSANGPGASFPGDVLKTRVGMEAQACDSTESRGVVPCTRGIL